MDKIKLIRTAVKRPCDHIYILKLKIRKMMMTMVTDRMKYCESERYTRKARQTQTGLTRPVSSFGSESGAVV